MSDRVYVRPNPQFHDLYRRKSDGELAEILVGVESYVPEAVAAAKEELLRRNLPQSAMLDLLNQARGVRDHENKGRQGTSWWHAAWWFLPFLIIRLVSGTLNVSPLTAVIGICVVIGMVLGLCDWVPKARPVAIFRAGIALYVTTGVVEMFIGASSDATTVETARSRLGVDPASELGTFAFVTTAILLAAAVVAIIGLYFFKGWARPLWSALFFISILSIPLTDSYVKSGWEELLYSIETTLGAMLTLSMFLEPIRSYFCLQQQKQYA